MQDHSLADIFCISKAETSTFDFVARVGAADEGVVEMLLFDVVLRRLLQDVDPFFALGKVFGWLLCLRVCAIDIVHAKCCWDHDGGS